ncbi:exosome complex component RRP46-like isoform X2 [Littorina saxatilis]|uniref:Exoribonuclease phosphorolytic domain-containing protein n=2 Tax=Littorina saxatilis TaxID=31220 RepID=A0AAN9GMM5_9CAEN
MEVMETSTNSPCLAALTCVLGDLSQADGSASFTHGNTSVLAATYGPCEVRMSKEILDQATVEVVCKPRVGLPNCADKYRERHIRDLFQATILVNLHPRSSVMIVLQERQDDGGLLATSINAACLALLDAGVSMKFLVAAVTALIDKDGNINLVPEEKPSDVEASASLTIVFNEKDLQVMGVTSSGKFSQEQYDRSVSLCRKATEHVFKFYRESMERKLSKSV